MKKPVAWTLALAAALGIAALVYYESRELPPEPQPEPAPPVAAAPAPQAGAEPKIRYPIETEEQPLPPLNASDDAMKEALAGLLGERSLLEVLNLDAIVRRVVATIDNLPRRKLAPRLMPVKPAAGPFLTTGNEDALVLNPQNYARYSAYVRLLDAIDSRKLVALYTRYYPLFQQAYWDLGYPGAYFNDRLVEVIDDVLVAPEVEGPIRLVRPKIYYRYADPELEALPAGQKILVRIGPENAVKVKAKLREIRSELIKAPTR